MEEFLIKNTTRQQREQIVKDSLGYCDLGCDEGGGAYGYDMYQPYIDGEKELSEITQEFRASYMRDMEREERGCCELPLSDDICYSMIATYRRERR